MREYSVSEIDDPLIQGMLQARDELESPGEKEAAGKIINGYLVEMNSEPESERIQTKFSFEHPARHMTVIIMIIPNLTPALFNFFLLLFILEICIW